MAKKETDPRLLNRQNSASSTEGRSYLGNKSSRLQNLTPRINYYSKTRYMNDGNSLENRFLYSYASQVIPTLLPGYVPTQDFFPPVPPLLFDYIVSEIDEPMMTEGDDNLIIE